MPRRAAHPLKGCSIAAIALRAGTQTPDLIGRHECGNRVGPHARRFRCWIDYRRGSVYLTEMDTLTRFHIAQSDIYEIALAELGTGRKVTHWMWFVFPQLRSLGRSSTAEFYGIADLDEARAYLADPVLGPRLIQAAQAVLAHSGSSAEQIVGKVDALKLRSSATLFREAADDGATREIFQAIIVTFYKDIPCPLTMDQLNTSP